MNQYDNATIVSKQSSVAANNVIKNTYTLLSFTLVFSAVTAGISMSLAMPAWTYLAAMIGAMLLIWLVLPRYMNSAAGIGWVFVITGLMGFGLGPLLNAYMSLPKGPEIVATALGGTGVIFFSLSAYALTTKKDFSFMTGFLFSGLLVVLVAMIANMFFAIPAMSLMISAVVVMLMSGYILYDTSAMIHGGETNYIRATIQLYLDIFNIFIHLLRIIGGFSSDD